MVEVSYVVVLLGIAIPNNQYQTTASGVFVDCYEKCM